MNDIEEIRKSLLLEAENSDNPSNVLKDPRLKKLYARIPTLPNQEKAEFGKFLNSLKQELAEAIEKRRKELLNSDVEKLDITAPFDQNQAEPQLFSVEQANLHPLNNEIQKVNQIFRSMGFEAVESRQIDNDFNMFETLNFPKDHPARDDYDTFKTKEGLIPPAHTSTMQNRILKAGKAKLERGENIAVVSYGRVFRNEDIDATHEHTFHQYEGVFVSEKANLSQMLGTLKEFFDTYYGADVKIKTQPAYFPFVEPGLEFMIEKPKAIGGKEGEWLEMLGCGMIHQNVLKKAGIDPTKYQGFAWGGGFERLVMLKYGITDIRYFESTKLDFLRSFK